jgi:hypothetical protein
MIVKFFIAWFVIATCLALFVGRGMSIGLQRKDTEN